MRRYKTGEILGEVRPNPENYKLPFTEKGQKKLTSPSNLEKVDIVLMQIPNLRESTYYAGMAALKAWMKKYKPEFSLFSMDPITDYFDSNQHLIHSEFGMAFNTFTTQGDYLQFSKYEEMHDICEIVYDEARKRNPKWLGFSVIDGNIDATLYIAKYIKDLIPDLKIILGGKGTDLIVGGIMTARYEDGTPRYDYEQWDFIDYIVYGDGEVPLEKIVESKEDSDKLGAIKGLAFRDWNELWYGWNPDHDQTNPKEQYSHTDFSIVPIPDYTDFQDTIQYKRMVGTTVPLILSRGCPFRCSFCSIPTIYEQFNFREIDSCIEEIEGYYSRGHREFFIQDSIINFRPDWLVEFCNRIIDSPILEESIGWGGNMRLMKPMRDFDTLKLYNDAGFWQMITGLESASPKVLRHMKKYSSIQGTREIFENIRELNKTSEKPIRILLQLIIGYVNESEEDFQMTMDFVEEFHDIIFEVTTCSLFLMWEPLVERWLKEGKWIDFKNEVEWETEFSTLDERLERGKRIEKLFKKLGLKYNIYLREQIASNADRQERGEGEEYSLSKDSVKDLVGDRFGN